MQKPRVVMTFGTFDLFHIGHLRILERAASLGDELVVGVSTDELNYRKKKKYPMIPEDERRAIIAALKCVKDTFYEESLEKKREYLLQWKADVLVMGDDWAGKFDEFQDICEVVYLKRTDNVSTTELEQFIKTRAPHERRVS